MNRTLRELLIKEHGHLKYALEGIGDEPDEEMAKDALSHKHAPVDWSKCQEETHAPSKITSHVGLPCCLRHIADHENEG